jgi:hypothetical protein
LKKLLSVAGYSGLWALMYIMLMRQAYFSIKGILAIVVNSATKIKHLTFSKFEARSDVRIQLVS